MFLGRRIFFYVRARERVCVYVCVYVCRRICVWAYVRARTCACVRARVLAPLRVPVGACGCILANVWVKHPSKINSTVSELFTMVEYRMKQGGDDKFPYPKIFGPKFTRRSVQKRKDLIWAGGGYFGAGRWASLMQCKKRGASPV